MKTKSIAGNDMVSGHGGIAATSHGTGFDNANAVHEDEGHHT